MNRIGGAGIVVAVVLCMSGAFAWGADAHVGKVVNCPSFKAPIVNGSYNDYTHIKAMNTSCKTAKKVLIAWEHWTPSHPDELGFACFASPLASKPAECTRGSKRITTKFTQHAASG